jgi:DNA-directed RNA polymerase alpha subunit
MTISINLDHLADEELHRIYAFLKLKFDETERQRALFMDLRDIHVQIYMDTRVINLLKSRRINTLKDLAACNRPTLQKINGMGPNGIRQIERLLNKYGLKLAHE